MIQGIFKGSLIYIIAYRDKYTQGAAYIVCTIL